MSGAITFDFHNTLVRCDRWFDLEVRSLPRVVSKALAGNGYLVASDELAIAYRALRAEIIEHGRELDAVDGVAEAFRRLGATVDPAEIEPIIDATMREALAETELLPGAESTIRFLTGNGVPIGIVSSAVHHQFLEWALSKLGVAEVFDAVVSSASAGYYKSRPEIYAIALDKLGARAARSVHIGDSYRFDHLAGQSAGLATVWLRDETADWPRNGSAPNLELTTLEGAGPPLLDLFRLRQGSPGAD